MTISLDQIVAVAPDVPAAAQERRGVTNPFISLQSLESLCQRDETLQECLREMVMLSCRYTETICRFKQIVGRGQVANEDDTRKQIEVVRSRTHDATIAAIKVLARELRKRGEDSSWIQNLEAGGRPAYYKFAILMAFESVLRER